MDEENTFNRLKRCSVEDMIAKLDEIKSEVSPMFTLGSVVCERQHYYPEMLSYLERVQCLKDHGWTPEDFYLELEKRAILDLVRDYNQFIEFPQVILERAKRIFPNAKFTPARIDLE